MLDREGGFPDAAQDLGRAEYEYRADHHQQEYRKDEHHRFRGLAQVRTDQVRQIGAAVPDGQHPRQIVVHRTGENAAEYNPQIRRRTELGSHDGAEDRPRTGNVQELDHENFPRRQHGEVHAVGFGHGRRRPVVRSENPFHKTSVEEIAGYQGQQGQDE